MAQMLIQIPDAQVQRVITALCDGIFDNNDPNFAAKVTPATPTPALAKQVVMDFIRNKVKDYENRKAFDDLPPPDVSTIVN